MFFLNVGNSFCYPIYIILLIQYVLVRSTCMDVHAYIYLYLPLFSLFNNSYNPLQLAVCYKTWNGIEWNGSTVEPRLSELIGGKGCSDN